MLDKAVFFCFMFILKFGEYNSHFFCRGKERVAIMKRIVLWCCILCALFPFSALAADLPVIALNPGENKMIVTPLNTTGRALHAVTLTVDASNLPKWLSVQCGADATDVTANAKADRGLALTLTVLGAPDGAVATVPLTFRDATGTVWSHSLPITVASAKPVPDALVENSPNPFNPATTISFSLTESRETSLVVYDTLGRTVRILLNGPLPGGKHTIRWDGRDDSGRAVSSGVYICRMRAGAFEKSIKMTFMR